MRIINSLTAMAATSHCIKNHTLDIMVHYPSGDTSTHKMCDKINEISISLANEVRTEYSAIISLLDEGDVEAAKRKLYNLIY